MDQLKIRGEFKHPQTPNARSHKQKSSTLHFHSPQKRIKAKSKPETQKSTRMGTSSTPKSGTLASPNKKPVHKRISSHHNRPTSTHQTKRSQFRRLSYDISLQFPVVSKYSYLSNTGYIPGNTSKTNQDNYIIHLNFANQQDSYLFAVCDGHGTYGGEVSSFIKQRLPQLLSADPDIKSNPKQALKASILKCNEELTHTNLDTKFSGSTLTLILIQGKTLYCANVGDSRCMLARQINDQNSKNKWMAISLSRDHKPDCPDENKRILKSGGRVQAYQDEDGNPAGPARVWLKSQDLPGLAMSRSLGDTIAASVGVIAEPEIASLELIQEDKFIVIGSDGVYEFITNEEIVKLGVSYFKVSDCDGMCEVIVKEATKKWRTEEEVIDDITAICVFLDIPNLKL